MDEFAFKIEENKEEKEINETKSKKAINFVEMPKEADEILDNSKQIIEKFTKEESMPVPRSGVPSTSYLSLVLSPDFYELEMMIRGLEMVKRFNPVYNKEEIILRKIPDHPLNEYGINTILSELKIYTSPEIKLGRRRSKDAIESAQKVGMTINRIIYKNLKKFGMDSQTKQRNAKRFSLACFETIYSSFSRSIEGRENDLSRATELKIEGNINPTDLYANFGNKKKEELKN